MWEDMGELVEGWEYRRSRDGLWQVRRKLAQGSAGPLLKSLLSIHEWVDERALPYAARPWRPFVETMPYNAQGQPDPEVLKGEEKFYANGHYLVFVRTMKSDDPAEVPDGKHLSMRTVENDTRHDWREMQRVKNELCGPEWEAVEIYPAESRLVDSANQYHLWCFPFRLPFGFSTPTPFTKTAEEAAAIGAKQRQREEHA